VRGQIPRRKAVASERKAREDDLGGVNLDRAPRDPLERVKAELSEAPDARPEFFGLTHALGNAMRA
jgi:hypothetical protein